MARRKAYTKVEKRNQVRPDHVQGMGDKAFKGFQCLNPECIQFITILHDDLVPDFQLKCDGCGFELKAGEAIDLFQYDLIDKRDESTIESGDFAILHDDYIAEAENYKYCVLCGAMKPLELFDRHSARKTGRQSECTLCKKMYNGLKNQSRLVEQHREASQKRRLYSHFDSEKLDVSAIYERYGSACFECGKDLSEDIADPLNKKLGNLDHTLPVYLLWPLTTGNATLLCSAHNGNKAEKWPGRYYTKAKLKELSAKTGIPHEWLNGEPFFNPDAITKLKDHKFVQELFEKFARYPEELIRLRNRILKETDFDFLEGVTGLSPDFKKRADEALR